MANSFSAAFPEFWSKEMQKTWFREDVALAVANVDLRAILTVGDKVNNPYGDYPTDQAYSKGTDISISDRTVTNDSITIDTIRVVAEYIDDYDELQSNYNIASHYAQKGQRVLNDRIDQLHNYTAYNNAASSIDAGDVGGSAGSGITLSATNAVDLEGAIREKLGLRDVNEGFYFMAGPRYYKFLRQNLAGRATSLGDKVMMNGYLGPVDGFDMYESNNCYFTATLGLATNVSEGDTVTIAGVVSTFNATPSGAGSIDLGSDVDTSRENLQKAINDEGTVDTTYIQYSALDRFRLIKAGVVATNNDSTAVTFVGYGELSTAETFTDTTDAWASQTVYYIAGAKKTTQLVVQAAPKLDFVRDPDRIGYNQFVHTLYGAGVWTNDAEGIVYAQVDASGWTTT